MWGFDIHPVSLIRPITLLLNQPTYSAGLINGNVAVVNRPRMQNHATYRLIDFSRSLYSLQLIQKRITEKILRCCRRMYA